MRLRSLIWIFWLSLTSFGQDPVLSSVIDSSLSDLLKTREADSIIRTWVSIGAYDTINANINLYSQWLYKRKLYNEAIKTSTLAIENEKCVDVLDLFAQQERRYILGRSLYSLNQYNASIVQLEHMLKIEYVSKLVPRAYFLLGKILDKKENYLQAIKHFTIAENLLVQQNDENTLMGVYFTLSNTYNLLKTFEGYTTARQYLFKMDSLTRKITTSETYKYRIKLGLGKSYNFHETLDIPKANKYYNEALKIARSLGDSTRISNVYKQQGNLYSTTNPLISLKILENSIAWTHKKDSIGLFSIKMEKSFAHLMLTDYKTALRGYHQALKYLIKDDNTDDSLEIPTVALETKGFYLLNGYKYIASAYLHTFKHSQNSNKTNLISALRYFRLADKVIDFIRSKNSEVQSKLFWRQQSSELYAKAIESCYLLDDATQAFYFMEKNKALLLIENLEQRQISFALPDSIIRAEVELKKKIYTLKNADHQSDSVAITLLQQQRALEKLQTNLANKFEGYKKPVAAPTILNLTDIQEGLVSDNAILMYNISTYNDYGRITAENDYTPIIPGSVYGSNKIHPSYGLLITKSEAKFFKVADPEHLKSNIRYLLNKIKKTFQTERDISSYQTTAYKVYKKLLPHKKLENLIMGKKLLIIPDNYLHYLPFEALVTTSHKKAPFWIEKNEIAYAYSNSFLDQLKSKDSKTELTYAGFAPVTFQNKNLLPLRNSISEIENSQQLFKGHNYTYAQANKTTFLDQLASTDVVHIATHAAAQDSVQPWIAFANDKLYRDELSLTSTNAKLVVLSGCETLLGKQETGEGVMSLARGFFQAGAQSVVSSLWSADDRATTTIMKEFYLGLSRGMTKSKALQTAKRNYLLSNRAADLSPYYWASFVLLGDTSPLITPAAKTWMLWFLPVFLILLLLLVTIKYSGK